MKIKYTYETCKPENNAGVPKTAQQAEEESYNEHGRLSASRKRGIGWGRSLQHSAAIRLREAPVGSNRQILAT